MLLKAAWPGRIVRKRVLAIDFAASGNSEYEVHINAILGDIRLRGQMADICWWGGVGGMCLITCCRRDAKTTAHRS